MQTLFLTGSTGALAGAIRHAYLEAGWAVAGFSRRGDTHPHPNYRGYAAGDATDEGALAAVMKEAVLELGAPRALVATVGGITPWKSVTETTVESFRDLVELNLTSLFVAAKVALPLMTAGGAVVTIGAEAALEPTALKGGYAASKAGVIALTRVIASEGKGLGISANVIVPGTIRTAANESWATPEMIRSWTTPEAIAATCLYLSSPHGRRVTDTIIRMPDRPECGHEPAAR